MQVDTTARNQLVDREQMLAAIGRTIRTTIARQGYCLITHPAQLHCLNQYREELLRDFAREHGTRLVVRAGGDAYEFTGLARA